MSSPDRPRPSFEQLNRYATSFNKSSALKLFGARLSFPSQALLRIEVDVRPEFRGGLGRPEVVNGGVLAALFDLAMGSACALLDPTRRAATMQLSMSFERPVTGARISVESELTSTGGRTAFATGRILDEAGVVCARCQGVIRVSTQTWDGDGPIVD